MSNQTPFEAPSLKRWFAWSLVVLGGLTALLAILLMQLEPGMRQALLSHWIGTLQTPMKLVFILITSLFLLLFAGMWYGLQSSMARDDLEDDPRVREPFKDRFVRGDLEPGEKVVCTECGDVHDAMDIDCPGCGSTEIETTKGVQNES